VPLAVECYDVHLLDPVSLHVEQALLAARTAGTALAGAVVGDARRLPYADASADAALLLGPLYHLTDRADRVMALREAHRVLRPGGRIAAAAISRFASTFDGLARGMLVDPGFEALRAIRRVEAEPSLLGASAHLLAVGRAPSERARLNGHQASRTTLVILRWWKPP
jgi:ubiquinone/menaquinone biosynthesis C-methylase UbiE